MFDGSFCLPACIYRGQWPSYFTTAWIKLSGTVFPIVYLCIFCSCVFFLLCYYSRLSRPTPDNQLWFHLVMLLCFIFGVRVTFKMSFLSVVWVCTFLYSKAGVGKRIWSFCSNDLNLFFSVNFSSGSMY